MDGHLLYIVYDGPSAKQVRASFCRQMMSYDELGWYNGDEDDDADRVVDDDA